MRRLSLIIIAISLSTACGSTPSPTTADGPRRSDGDSSAGGEFQLSSSDTAGSAHGERPSEIAATSTEAAMRLFVVDPDTGPIPGVVIKLTAPDGQAYYTGETDSQGYAEVLVPAGQRYELEYLSLGRRTTTARVEVPEGPNQDIRLTLRHRPWRPPARAKAAQADTATTASDTATTAEPAGLVLEGILFDTGRATLQPASNPRLDRVVEYMDHRPNVRIRIAGHTDNVGDPRANQALSEARARAVRDYLVSHGIEASRIEATGYGDRYPVASNDSEEGRQQNRRIEAVEL